ncbi:acyltransferase, partial [Campylobacter lanienae]|uniref:acyltransferase n=1 Tax=Campylobacter lanienae TaxID=75658 RepID=UPI00243318FD
MQKHIRENGNVIYAYESLDKILNNSNIKFNGKNNILFLCSGAKIGNSNIEFVNDNSLMFLCSTNLRKTSISLRHDSVCYIGNNSYFNPYGTRNLFLAERQNIIFGNGCFFSTHIEFSTLDWHLIYDNDTNLRINSSKSIYLGDHVWIGMDALILKGSMIYSGAIIGARGISTKQYYSNTANAGNPARQIKENIFWDGKCPQSYTKEQIEKIYYYDRDDFKFTYNQNEFLSPKAIEAKLDSLNTAQEKLEFVYDAIYMNKNKNRFAYFKDMPYDIPLPKYESKFKLLKFEEIEPTLPKPTTPPQPTPQEQINSLKEEINKIDLEIKNLEITSQNIKNHLSYKLGNALIKAHKQWYKGGYIKFIFEAI